MGVIMTVRVVMSMRVCVVRVAVHVPVFMRMPVLRI